MDPGFWPGGAGRFHQLDRRALARAGRLEPVRSTPLQPLQNAIESPAQHWYVFGQQHQAEGEHPYPEHGKDAEKAADD